MRIAWLSDPPMLTTGFGTTTRLLASFLLSEGFFVDCYSLAVNFNLDYNYDGMSIHVKPVLNHEKELDDYDVVIGTWNPEYVSQASAYYDAVWKGIHPKRKIGYFVHETRHMPRQAGPVFYEYDGSYDLVFTTPAQDIWGHHEDYPESVHFIPHPVDLRAFRAHRHHHNDWVTAVMTNDNPRKRWDLLVMALPKIRADRFRFVVSSLVGAFRIPEMLDAVAPVNDDDKPEVRIGPEDDMPALYASTSVLVLPTTGEAFSYPVAEALAGGASVVATDLPEFRELYGDAVTYIPARDWLMPDGSIQRWPDPDGIAPLVNERLEKPDPHPEAVLRYDVKKVGRLWADLISDEKSRVQERGRLRPLRFVRHVLGDPRVRLFPLWLFSGPERAYSLSSFWPPVFYCPVVRPHGFRPFWVVN